MLIEELASIGLHVNGKKTKIMTNVSPSYNYFDISGELVTVLGNNETHRYLGRLLCGDLSDRAATEIKNRLQNSWYKFSQHSRTLTNRNISIKLRLKLFDSVITPSILFGLAALPVTQAYLDKVDATQRKMMRQIVGWVRNPGEPWNITMQRMNDRVSNATNQYSIKSWSQQIFKAQWKYIQRLKSLPDNS